VSVGEVLANNHRADVELLGDVNLSLQALLKWGAQKTPATDRAWSAGLRQKHLQRVEKLQHSMSQEAPGSDGLMHPNRLLSALRDALPADSVVVADGGDFLSFTRVGLPATTYLDPGSLGCIGVGTPFGVAASLVHTDKTVVVATGDGAFGFNAMEMDTAVRHQAPVLIVVANNGSWAIEVRDQQETHGKVVGTRLQFSDYAGMAKSFGMHAQRVEREEDLAQAIQTALQNRPALLDVLVTPEAASSDAKSGLAWVPNLQALAAWDDAERRWRDAQTSQA
jgi:acetolactate synthase-1/2/3 large subunit